MTKAFLWNIALLVAVNLLVKPLYIFGIEIPMQNVVGNESYGTFFTFFAFTMLFQIINEAGLQQYASRTVSRDRSVARNLLSKLTLAKIGLGAAYMVLIAATGWLLGYWNLDVNLLLLVGFNQILLGFIPYLRSYLSSLGYYHWEGLVSALDKVLMILIIGYFLYFQRDSFDIYTFVLGQTAAFLLTLGIIFLLLNRLLRPVPEVNNAKSFRQVIGGSLGFGLIVFLSMVYTRIDAVMIEQLLDDGPYMNGIYGAAFRLMDAANMFAYLFAGLLLPMFSRLIGTGKSTDTLYALSFRLVALISISLSAFVWIFKVQIMQLLYADYTDLHAELLGILFIAFIAKASTYVSGTLLMAHDELRRFNWLLGITVIVNIILNYYWISSKGPSGAAWATAVTQVIVALGCLWLLKKHISARIQGTTLVRIIVFLILTIALVYVWPSIDPPRLSWYYSGLIVLIICTGAGAALGLISPRALINLGRQRLGPK